MIPVRALLIGILFVQFSHAVLAGSAATPGSFVPGMLRNAGSAQILWHHVRR